MPRIPHYWIFLLLCSISCRAVATTIHSWVDDDGVTHFSDGPPAGKIDDTTVVELDDKFPPVPDTQADYYSIANQWKRMREEREAKDQLSLEKARIRSEQSAALVSAEPPPVEQSGYGGYYPIYGFPGHNVHRHPGQYPDDRNNTFRRGPHHVQAGHGRLSHRSRIREGNNDIRGGHPGAHRGGAGLSFEFPLH